MEERPQRHKGAWGKSTDCHGVWAASRSWERVSNTIFSRSSKSVHPLSVPDLKRDCLQIISTERRMQVMGLEVHLI